MASIGPCFEYAIKKTIGIVKSSFAGRIKKANCHWKV
jgi:hypothetical protein